MKEVGMFFQKGSYDKRAKKVKEALKHFGISSCGEITVADNDEKMRRSCGIETVGEIRGKKGKFRVTVYYDPDYPLILRHVVKEC